MGNHGERRRAVGHVRRRHARPAPPPSASPLCVCIALACSFAIFNIT